MPTSHAGDTVQVAVIIMMASTSAAIWWLWWRRWKAVGEIWQRAEASVVVWNPAAVFLGLAAIGLNLWPTLQPRVADAPVKASVEGARDSCLFYGVLVAVLLPLLVAFDWRRLRDFGFSLARWRRQLVDGIETAIASFLPTFAVLAATSPWRTEVEQHLLLRLLREDTRLQTLGTVLLAAVVLAPLAEELLFRVILLGWLKTRTTRAVAIGVSAIVFSVIHGQLDGVALIPLALLLGCLYDRQQLFLPVFVTHAFFNLTNIVLALAAR